MLKICFLISSASAAEITRMTVDGVRLWHGSFMAWTKMYNNFSYDMCPGITKLVPENLHNMRSNRRLYCEHQMCAKATVAE